MEREELGDILKGYRLRLNKELPKDILYKKGMIMKIVPDLYCWLDLENGDTQRLYRAYGGRQIPNVFISGDKIYKMIPHNVDFIYARMPWNGSYKYWVGIPIEIANFLIRKKILEVRVSPSQTHNK